MLNTPGFTAELALSGPARAYRSSAGPYVGTGLVQPALLNIRKCIQSCGGDDLCVECCVCIARGGHPQHCCM
jgi:hypothetical protein